MALTLEDRFYGCLIGGAIGDALGSPTEGMNYWEIRERHGTLTELIASPRGNTNQTPGGVSDDTALRHYIALAIVRRQGRIRPEDLADLWLEKGNSPRFWSNEKAVWEKLRWGTNPWDSGRGAMQCATGSMAIAPVGLINAGNPAQAYIDGYVLAGINQDGPERDAAGSMSAGVAAACAPDASPQSVIEAIHQHSTYLMQRAIDLTLDLAARCATPEQFTEQYYAEFADWSMPRPPRKLNDIPGQYPQRARYYSGSSFEIIPVALAMLNYVGWDVDQAVVACSNVGRDCDTMATIAGNLAGALRGVGTIKRDWIDTCERANADLFEFLEGSPSANFHSMALRLADAYRASIAAARQQLDLMQQIEGERINEA